jgi:hypothetical protein
MRRHFGNERHRRMPPPGHIGSISQISLRWLIARLVDSWDTGQSAPVEIRHVEHALEVAVSDRIRVMPFLWVAIDDPLGSESTRKFIERNA